MTEAVIPALPYPTQLYQEQVIKWPSSGKHILASYDEHSIVVYQAYNDRIANAVMKAKNFYSDDVIKAGYSSTRMTWIKTNFLWMMYRSGWASKPNQERILAIRITRHGFEEILLEASTHGPGSVRLQWDPDHTPHGVKVQNRRAIQLGLRGDMLDKFLREFTIEIMDITDFVKEQAQHITDTCEFLKIPVETVYRCSEDAAINIRTDKS